MRIMIVGASHDPAKFGHKAVRAYLAQGHEVFPVNPRGGDILGIRVHTDVASVPGPIDRASIYLPPEKGHDTLRALAARGDVGEVWLNPGAESDELVELARSLGINPILACSIVDIGEHP